METKYSLLSKRHHLHPHHKLFQQSEHPPTDCTHHTQQHHSFQIQLHTRNKPTTLPGHLTGQHTLDYGDGRDVTPVLEAAFKLLNRDHNCITTPHRSNITNLSAAFSPTVAQLELLEKGLSFIPTPKLPTQPEIRADLHAFHRRIKIMDHFLGSRGRQPVLFTGPSTWEPHTATSTPEITQLINKNLLALTHWRPLPHSTPNISQEQQQIIKTLGNSQHIVIKPADKGGQIVIQDRDNYILEAHRQLNDNTYYRLLTHPLQLETQTLVRDITATLYTKKL